MKLKADPRLFPFVLCAGFPLLKIARTKLICCLRVSRQYTDALSDLFFQGGRLSQRTIVRLASWFARAGNWIACFASGQSFILGRELARAACEDALGKG